MCSPIDAQLAYPQTVARITCMETQFELLLPNARKNQRAGIGFGGLYAGIWLAWIASMVNRLGFSSAAQHSLFLLMLAATLGLMFLPWLIRKLAYEPHLVRVEADRLLVHNQVSGEEQDFPFGNIARYRIVTSKNGAVLWFRYHDGSKQGLSSNDFTLLQVAPALTKALQHYEQQHGEPPKFRDNSFFGNPASTWMLGVLLAIVIVVSWAVGIPAWSSAGFFGLFFLYFLFMLYLVAWYEDREKRRNY